MNILENELLQHRSFLRLTREHSAPFTKSMQARFADLNLNLLDTGVLLIEPLSPGPLDIIISSGIHGNETAPIEICDQLVNDILNGAIEVKNRLLFIIGNPPAMNSGQRFETENLNRLFCNKHLGKTHQEAKQAAQLEKYTREFFNRSAERCHFDLHTAIRSSKYQKFAIYPYQDGRQWKKQYLNFFKDCAISTILLAHQAAGTFSYYTCHEFQANAFTVELGQVKPFGENDMESFKELIVQLGLLISDQYRFNDDFDNNDFDIFQVVDEVIRQSETGFSLNISSDSANFSQFPVGFQLTSEDNGGYKMKSEQHAIVFPNAQVPIGQRVALIVDKSKI